MTLDTNNLTYGITNLHEHLSILANADPTRTALCACDIDGNVVEEISRATLLKKIEEYALYLQSKELRVGDRVALAFSNCVDLLLLSWAAWSIGIITVPLDTKRDTGELREYKIKTSGATLLITQEDFLVSIAPVPEKFWMHSLSHEALILFTSGTTARPKGALLTLGNLVVNAVGIIEWLHITEEDRFLVELPLHHINSTTFCLATLIAGASLAIPPTYSHSRFFRQAANSAATLTSVVPSIIFDQLGRTQEYAAEKNRLKLNRIQVGSAPVVASVASAFIGTFGVPLYQGYGQTETALRVTGVPMDLSALIYDTLVSENSIGTPMRWARVEIADAAGQIVGEQQEGELIVTGPAVMQGYVGGEAAFRDEYFLTGDIGYWKNIGGRRFFYLIGRSKEIIIKGGINISPVAVENALKQIEDTIEQVYVIGVVDDRYGEEVGAVIVWREGVEAIGALRKLKLTLLMGHEKLSAYETPKYLTSVGEGELPMTSTGKVQRVILKKTLGEKMSSLYALMQSAEFRFVVLSSQSPLGETSRVLYNHCWQPLVKDEQEYKNYLDTYLTIGALDTTGTLQGQISFSRNETALCCVSICSAAYKPKPVPNVTEVPTPEFVREYLIAGNDPVMNFHHRLGAELVEVTPGGRPEDVSSLGYTMVLRYHSSDFTSPSGSAANQLIQLVRLLAHDVGLEVTAISRPGGLAAYLQRVA